MTPQQARVVQAEADALAARTRLTGSVTAVQDRLRPATLIREARRELRDAGASANRLVGRNPDPAKIGGMVLGALVLGVPLIRWRRRRRIAARAARIRGD